MFHPESQPWNKFFTKNREIIPCDVYVLFLEKTQRNFFEVSTETEGCREGTEIRHKIHEGEINFIHKRL